MVATRTGPDPTRHGLSWPATGTSPERTRPRRSTSVAPVHPIEHLRYVARARGADPVSLVREAAHALSSMRFDPSGLVVACRRIVERHPDCAPLWWLCARLVTSDDPVATAWEVADAIADDDTPTQLVRSLPDDATVVTLGRPALTGAALARRGDIGVLAVDADETASGFVQRLERLEIECEAVPAEGLAAAVGLADLVLVEVDALSPSSLVGPPGTSAALLLGGHLGVPVWLVSGVGRCLPDDLIGAMWTRTPRARWHLDRFELPGDTWGPVTRIVRSSGSVEVAATGGPRAALLAADCPSAPELLRTSPI